MFEAVSVLSYLSENIKHILNVSAGIVISVSLVVSSSVYCVGPSLSWCEFSWNAW